VTTPPTNTDSASIAAPRAGAGNSVLDEEFKPHHRRFAALLAVMAVTASLASAETITPEFSEYPDAAAVGNFAVDDLIQGLVPDKVSFLPYTNSRMAYAGFVHPDGAAGQSALMKWSGSGFTCRFRSSICRLRFAAPSGSRYWVKVDETPFVECALDPVIDLTAKLSVDRDAHEVQIVKKTEPDSGLESFLGIELSRRGKLLRVTRPKRKILFLGDSITVGMGAGANGETDFLRSYAWLLSQHFSAEPRLVALSGVGLFEGWRSPLFNVEWQQVAAQASEANTTVLSWQPDLIVVNLSTNDKSKGVAGTDVANSMKELLVDVRQRCPKAIILVMVPWSYGCYREELRAGVGEFATAGDARIHFVNTDPGTWVPEGGMRDNTHPNTKGHQQAAEMLIPIIESAMKW